MSRAPDVLTIPTAPVTPDRLRYEDKEKLILRAYIERGMMPSEIAFEYGLPIKLIRRVCSAAQVKRRAVQIQKKVTTAIFKDKAPVMEAIADIGLSALFEWNYDFFKSGKHKKMSMQDAKCYSDLVEKLGNMWRVHNNKPTEIHAHAITEVKANLNDILKQVQAAPEDGGDPFSKAVDVEFAEVRDEESKG